MTRAIAKAAGSSLRKSPEIKRAVSRDRVDNIRLNYPRASEGGGKVQKRRIHERRKCVTEQRSGEQAKRRIKANRLVACVCTTGTTGPGKDRGERKKRAKRESWFAREKTKKSCCCAASARDAGPWDSHAGLKELVPLDFSLSLFSGNAHRGLRNRGNARRERGTTCACVRDGIRRLKGSVCVKG